MVIASKTPNKVHHPERPTFDHWCYAIFFPIPFSSRQTTWAGSPFYKKIFFRSSFRFLSLLLAFFFLISVVPVIAGQRPNVLWIVVDDMSTNFSCYGETSIQTPNIDRIAKEGVMFSHAYATAPVCSSSRSAMITGMYQTNIGAHHHRSGRGEHRIQLPSEVRLLPELFQEAGYFTCIGSGVPGIDFRSLPTKSPKLGKTDYNFEWDPAIYDSHDWAERKKGQPFFMQVQLHGGKLRGDTAVSYDKMRARAVAELGSATEPDKVNLPPYYPRDPVLLDDWAAYLDSVRMTDWHVGQVLARLKAEGILEETLVIFMTDHGISHARGKQFLYDEGSHIPFVIRGPGMKSGTIREDLVEHIDMGAISLAAAGLKVPDWMQGRDVFANDYKVREAVYAARDRCGEAADRIRSVRTPRFLYIRNFYPERPLLMPNDYKDHKAIIQRLRELAATDSLAPLSREILFAPARPAEELYAWTEDPSQIHNLAMDSEQSETLSRLSTELDEWIVRTGDPGAESPEIYALEIADELSVIKPETDRYRTFKANAEVYKQWMAEEHIELFDVGSASSESKEHFVGKAKLQ